MNLNIVSTIVELTQTYNKETEDRVKLIDYFLISVLLTGIIQLIYCLIVGTFPFNAFLSGFFVSIGSFVITGKEVNNL